MQALVEAGVHLGHRTKDWNPKMRRFIYGERNGFHVIDLTQTAMAIETACDFLRHAAKEGKHIVFVGTKLRAAETVEYEASRCKCSFVTRRWLGGTLTNFETLRGRILRLRELNALRASGEFFRRPKREVASLNRELSQVEKDFRGLAALHGAPEVLIVTDTNHEIISIKEAKKAGAIVVALVDSNSDPDDVHFPIPANDDSLRSIRLVLQLLSDAIIEGAPETSDGSDWQSSRVPNKPRFPERGTEVSLAHPSESESPD